MLSSKDKLKNFTEFIDFINEFLLPVLQGYLKELEDYKFGIRLIRLMYFLIQHLQIGLNQTMEFMSNSLDAKPWLKRLVFEMFNNLFTQPSIVNQILSEKELLGHLEICLISIQNFLEANKYELGGKDKADNSRGIHKYLDVRMIDAEKPDSKLNEMMLLSIEATTGLIECISNNLFPNGLDTSENISSHSSEAEERLFTIPFAVSKLILRILSVLLEKSSHDTNIQSILNSMQVYINITGMKK